MTEYKRRISRLSSLIKNKNHALVIRANQNVFYLTGFNNCEGTVLITNSGAYLLVDFRYIESAKNIVDSCTVILCKNLLDDIKHLLIKDGVEKVYIEAKHTVVDFFNRLSSVMGDSNIIVDAAPALDNAVENLRIIKSSEEIEFIQKAQEITEKAYADILKILKPGISEKDLKDEFEYKIKRYGAEGPSFDLITITGSKTSLPHGVPGDALVKNGDFVTFDVGSVYRGYHSDMTRTVAVGNVTRDMKDVYSIVKNAQSSALEAVCAGKKARDIDKTARDIIAQNGYADCFGHSTGHGVGLDIHESPAVSPKSDTILSDGMVITIEPGIYLENRFGVRIEDMVLVKENGCFNFAKVSKDLIVL